MMRKYLKPPEPAGGCSGGGGGRAGEQTVMLMQAITLAEQRKETDEKLLQIK